MKEELCSFLARLTKSLQAGKTTIETAKLHAKVAGQILDTYKIQIEYAKLSGIKPKAEHLTAVKLIRDARQPLVKELQRLRKRPMADSGKT